jgi:hypothetical protein
LTDKPDLLNRVISSLESAVLEEIVGRLGKMNAAGERCHTSKVSRARHPAVAAAIAL